MEEIRYSLSHFDGATSYKWMIIPEMRFLISSHYKVVLFFLLRLQSLTFLPLRTTLIPIVARQFISIGFVKTNHFIELYLRN